LAGNWGARHGIGIGEIAARLKEDEPSTVIDTGGSVLKTSLGYASGKAAPATKTTFSFKNCFMSKRPSKPKAAWL
jgi:hypothetical protein